jgi:outer membrane protein
MIKSKKVSKYNFKSEGKKMKKQLFTAAFLLAVLLISNKSFAGEYKIGYVAIQIAVVESAAGKDTMAKFQEEIKAIEDTILKEKASIEKLGEVLQKQSMMLTDSVRREKEKDFLRRQRDYERQVKDSKSEVQLKEAELTNDILQDLIPIIQEYGKKNGFTIIFEKNERNILYASDAIDLTAKVTAIYDAQYKKNKK